jgi:hypothetical protein
MGTYVLPIKGVPISIYAKTKRQAEHARDYIEKTMDVPDLSPAAQAARMANALYEAKQKK